MFHEKVKKSKVLKAKYKKIYETSEQQISLNYHNNFNTNKHCSVKITWHEQIKFEANFSDFS